MLASPKKMEKEKASKGDPKSISILEKQRASYRDQLEQAAKAAAKDFVEKARPERRPSIAKKLASKQSQKAGSKKKPGAKRDQERRRRRTRRRRRSSSSSSRKLKA